MAQKTEVLSSEIIDNLKSLQSKSNEFVITLGQIHLRKRELQLELDSLKTQQTEIESVFDENNKNLNKIIKDLEKLYPMGEVDLNQGIVIYESAE